MHRDNRLAPMTRPKGNRPRALAVDHRPVAVELDDILVVERDGEVDIAAAFVDSGLVVSVRHTGVFTNKLLHGFVGKYVAAATVGKAHVAHHGLGAHV
jgi:hypothetical protein